MTEEYDQGENLGIVALAASAVQIVEMDDDYPNSIEEVMEAIQMEAEKIEDRMEDAGIDLNE